jgi:hypothetical protein
MKPDQFIGWTLLNSTAVTGITSTRVTYGLRPIGSILPAINFYDVGGLSRFDGVSSAVFSINCRATTARAARDLADIVLSLFAGSDARGTTGTGNTFAADRVSLVNDGGLIPEPDDSCFNVPIDIRVVSNL